MVAVVRPEVLRGEEDGDALSLQVPEDAVAVERSGTGEAIGVGQDQQVEVEPLALESDDVVDVVAGTRHAAGHAGEVLLADDYDGVVFEQLGQPRVLVLDAGVDLAVAGAALQDERAAALEFRDDHGSPC